MSDEPRFELGFLKRLWPFVRPYRRAFGLCIAVLAISFCLELVGPYLVRRALDGPLRVRTDDAASELWWLGALFLVVTLASAGLGWVFGMWTAWNGQRVVRDVRRHLFAHVLALPTSFHDRNAAGKLTTRLTTDVENLNELIATGVLATIFDLMKIFGVLAVLFFLDPLLAAFTLCATPVVIVLSLLFRGRVSRSFHRVRGALADQNGFSAELVGGVRTVRAFGREEEISARYADLNATTADAWRETVASFSQFFALVDSALRLTTIGLLYFAGRAITGGEMHIGEFVQFWLYYGLLTGPIKELGEKYNVLQAAFASAQRIFGILDQSRFPESPGREPWPGPGPIEAHDVRYAYGDGPEVLRGVSLRADPGRTVAVVGPTGAGKSTLIHLLIRAFDPTAGRVTAAGIDLRAIDRQAFCRAVAIVPQDVFLFTGSILENVRLFDRSISEQQVRRCLEEIGALEFVDALPEGLHFEVQERGGGLSQGQRQLLAFARALVLDPRVLVLDEATASLDSPAEARLQAAVERLRRGRTVFVVAHRLATVRSADEILVLDQGQVVERGTHTDLVRAGGHYAAMVSG